MITIARSDLRRVVVAIDPAASHGEESDDTGIIVVGRGPHQPSTCKLEGLVSHCPGHAYVLDDRTCHAAPHVWAAAAVAAFDEWDADLIVGEVNNGGDMVESTVRNVRPGIAFKQVRATRGKRVRAEPVAALYEQNRVHHVGVFSDLETQQTTWTPDDDDSPDRLDALVWGVTALELVGGQGAAFLSAWRRQTAEPAPRRGHNRPAARLQVLRGGLCDHRWRGDGCVFCGERRTG